MTAYNFKDLTSYKFGKLTVLRRGPDYVYTVRSGKRRGKKATSARWYCICECGRESLVLRDSLKRKGTKSCGCLRENVVRNLFGGVWKDFKKENEKKFYEEIYKSTV